MKRGKILVRRLLAGALSFAMVLSMAGTNAFAEGTSETTDTVTCICTEKCTADRVNGDCPECSAEEADLDNVCLGETGEGLGEASPEEPPEGASDGLSEELQALQERINALPSAEEYRAMDEAAQETVYETAAELSEEYVSLPGEEQAKLDITRMEELFAVINEDTSVYDTAGTVTFLNSGYPYGRDMSSSTITLVIQTEESAGSYQWQAADSKNGSFENIEGASESTHTFAPTSGKWYRCEVNGTASKAVMAVYPGRDGRTWTKPYSSWYISNGAMAYMANGKSFDAVGLYTKNGTDYMLCTSYGKKWDLFSSASANPRAGDQAKASLDALKVAFDPSDDYNIFFEASG